MARTKKSARGNNPGAQQQQQQQQQQGEEGGGEVKRKFMRAGRNGQVCDYALCDVWL
jgi:hypothetical protein